MIAHCPTCGGRSILAVATTTHLVLHVDARTATGAPFGTSFPLPLDARAMCNARSCGWVGTVRETRR